MSSGWPPHISGPSWLQQIGVPEVQYLVCTSCGVPVVVDEAPDQRPRITVPVRGVQPNDRRKVDALLRAQRTTKSTRR